MTEKTKIIERIQKLLRMAEDTSSPNEAAIAAARAHTLMEKYQLSNREVVLEDLKSGANMAVAEFSNGKRSTKWLEGLYIAVAKYHDVLVRKQRSAQGVVYQVCGYKDDVEVAVQVFEVLKSTVDRLADRDYKGYKAQGGMVNGRSWKDSYRKGAVNAIAETLRNTKAEEQQAQAGTSLVVVKSQAIAEHYGRARYSNTRTRTGNHDSYTKGYEEGKKVQLNKAIAS